MESLVSKVKQGIVCRSSQYSLVSPSAYDTAWVAMIPHPDHPGRPLFPRCLYWILRNQRRGGFWGQTDHRGVPTLDCITATLACIAALKTWGAGEPHCIEEGLDFLHSSAGELLATHCDNGDRVPRWFAIVFPGMLEVAESLGLDVFRRGFFDVVKGVFEQRTQIISLVEKEHDEASAGRGGRCYLPLQSYLEVLPSEYAGVDCAEVVASYQGDDGSLFRSPSATAFAFMATGDESCRAYLETMVAEASLGGVSQGVGVPAIYPADELLPKLFMVDTLERLGVAEHFVEEIADAMSYVHNKWTRREEPDNCDTHGQGKNMPLQLYEDALAFRLLRMHGYQVTPGRLCWFLRDEDAKLHVEKNHGCYLSAMLNVYRATHLAFPGEEELEEAKTFCKGLLRKGGLLPTNSEDGVVVFMDFQRQVEQELGVAWLARMDHLEHRRFIEQANCDAFWVAKASFYKFLFASNTDVLRLAAENFAVRQSTYRNELEELNRWSKDAGLSNAGFGREKTAYIYFSAAVTSHLPLDSEVRKIITKCGVLVTVADDFYDMEGELDELHKLAAAVERWEGRDLSGHSKVIFDALHDLVEDVSVEHLNRHGYDQKEMLRNIWRETFGSWLKEAEWSRIRHAPPMGEYIRVGMISIAIQAMILPACYLLNPIWQHPVDPTKPYYDEITRSLMVQARLLNDLQSYEKECLEGKLNMVMLLKNKGLAHDIGESVACVKRLLEAMKKEFLELALLEGGPSAGGGIPMEWKQLHLCCLKSFQMFFNGKNVFDSPTALLRSIGLAIYDPLTVEYRPSNDPAEDTESIEVEDEEDVSVTDWFLRQGKELLPGKKPAVQAAPTNRASKDVMAGPGGRSGRVSIIVSPRPRFRLQTNSSATLAHSITPRCPVTQARGLMSAGV